MDTSWKWDWFATLTFDQLAIKNRPAPVPVGASHDVVGWSLSSHYWDQWMERLQGTSGLRDIYWLRGREPNPNNPGTHFHALIGGVSELRRTDAWREWSRHGFSRILPYGLDERGQPIEGAARYVSKYVVKGLGDIQFSPNLGRMKVSEK